MNPSRTRRHALSLLAIGRCALALAVFLWGTSYKLSLYPVPGQSFERIPEAKLLSEEECPREARSLPIATVVPRPVALLCVAVLIVFAVTPRLRLLYASPLVLRSCRSPWANASALSFFFFRPPPAPASSPSLS
jgi:hypothetical protein